MTDRIKALTVFLERDIREDDIEPLVDAIRMLRDVSSVETHVTSLDDEYAVDRARYELRKQMRDVLWQRE